MSTILSYNWHAIKNKEFYLLIPSKQNVQKNQLMDTVCMSNELLAINFKSFKIPESSVNTAIKIDWLDFDMKVEWWDLIIHRFNISQRSEGEKKH